jgi:hypothetical protein
MSLDLSDSDSYYCFDATARITIALEAGDL